MKYNYLFFVIGAAMMHSFILTAQQNAEKKIIATLGEGETMAYGEDCFILNAGRESFSFVTVKGSGTDKEYFCYGSDGKKTGPVSKPDASYWQECLDFDEDDCAVSKETPLAAFDQYFDYTDGSINFNGRKIGPYGQPMLFNLSEDEQSFYCVCLTTEMKFMYFDNTGRTVDIIGMPEKIIISPDGKNAFLKVSGDYNPFDNDALQKMMEDPESMNDPKIFLFGIDGKKYGPYASSSFRDTWFTPSGQWIVYNGSELTLNGKSFIHFDDYTDPCDIWISSKGNDFAYANYEKLQFKDGSNFIAPFAIKYIMENGHGMLKWISLENGNTLVHYQREL